MFDVWSVLEWWDDWQLRILVLGSLGIQWFLMVAAPMRKYSLRRYFRLCIRIAYISSDAVAIYALGTLFNRHARATTSSCRNAIASDKARILEVLWAPVLLIHLGGQEELMAFTIEDTDLWVKHTVTLVSQVAVALYAFYKSWWHNPRDDGKLLVSEILLFIIGVVSCSEKPWALRKASSNRSASLSAMIQGTKKKRTGLADLLFSDWYSYFTNKYFTNKSSNLPEDVSWYNTCFCCSSPEREAAAPAEDNEVLSKEDKVYMLLSDMSLSAAVDDLVRRGRARNVHEVLWPLSTEAVKEVKHWLRGAFGLMYTRATLVFTRTYLVYHVLVVPTLHIAALTLFVRSDKDGIDPTDVKVTYILLCLTAALDVFPVFISQLLNRAMSATSLPALCERVPGYNLVDAVFRRRQKAIGWLVKCATSLGWKEEYFDYCNCKGGRGQDDYTLYKNLSEMVLADLVDAQGRDLGNYRVFTVPYDDAYASVSSGTAERPLETAGVEIIESSSQRQDGTASRRRQSSPGAANWALSEEQQKMCGPRIRSTLCGSFDRSVLVWHVATDLCVRLEGPPPANQEGSLSLHWLRIKCTEAISSYMARLLNSHPDMLLTGSRQHLVSEAMDELESILRRTKVDDSGNPLGREDLNKIIDDGEQARFYLNVPIGDKGDQYKEVPIAGRKTTDFHIPEACSLAKELLAIDDASMRWSVMYRVWVGMLFYSASMCRGYLHAKSLGEGGEFLSYVWLVLSLKGAKTLADKLQMLEGDEDREEPTPDRRQPLTDLERTPPGTYT